MLTISSCVKLLTGCGSGWVRGVEVRHKVCTAAPIKLLNFAAQHPSHVKGWLQVEHPPNLYSKLQYGKRITKEQWWSQQKDRFDQWYVYLAAKHDMPLSHPILDLWLNSDWDSWRLGMSRTFWTDTNSTASTVESIRQHYGDDSDLLAVADWLEYWNKLGVKVVYKARQ
jgi:hypothetical protein